MQKKLTITIDEEVHEGLRTVNSVSYSITAYGNGLYGEVYLNLLFFLPTGVIGYVMWRRHSMQDKTVAMRQLNRPQRLIITVICISCTAGLGALLRLSPSQNTPLIEHHRKRIAQRSLEVVSGCERSHASPGLGDFHSHDCLPDRHAGLGALGILLACGNSEMGLAPIHGAEDVVQPADQAQKNREREQDIGTRYFPLAAVLNWRDSRDMAFS